MPRSPGPERDRGQTAARAGISIGAAADTIVLLGVTAEDTVAEVTTAARAVTMAIVAATLVETNDIAAGVRVRATASRMCRGPLNVPSAVLGATTNVNEKLSA